MDFYEMDQGVNIDYRENRECMQNLERCKNLMVLVDEDKFVKVFRNKMIQRESGRVWCY